MAKKHLLKLLLEELNEQVQLVEPHQDNEIDIAGYRNAKDLINMLILHAEGNADLRKVCVEYFKNKTPIPETSGAYD